MTGEPFDRYDEAKRALEDVPAHDVWAEAQRRAADGSVAPLAPVAEPRRHSVRWIAGAAAAAVLLIVGAVAVRNGDDDPVSSGPGSDGEVICGFTSAPPVTDGPSEALTDRVGSPPPSVMHGVHPSESGRDYPFEVSSPADDGIVIGPEDAGDDISARSFAIARGEATVIADSSVSQLTWSPAGASPCETFSVTVAGPPGEEMDGVLLSVADAITLTGPEGTTDAQVATYQADGACKLGITGEPLPEPTKVSPAETFQVDDSGDPVVGTLVEGNLNPAQFFAVQVPGQVVTDLVGERVEDVQLRRGTAQLWFQTATVAPDGRQVRNPVQVRWFTGSHESCESFTVTVDGGTEDENRHAAVDLAERVLMSHELEEATSPPSDAAENVLANTQWQLERSTVDGQATDGNGATFTFTEDHATWKSCNTFDASYTYDDEGLHVGEATSTTRLPCPSNPTMDAINAVMSSDPIAVTIDGDQLELRAGSTILVLRPLESGEDPTTTTSVADPGTFDTSTLIGTRWVVTALHEGGEAVALPDHSNPVEFVDGAIHWQANCNSASTPVTYGIDTITVTGPTEQTLIGCEDTPGDGLIRAVLTSQADDPSAPPRSVQRGIDTLQLKIADKVVTLSPA